MVRVEPESDRVTLGKSAVISADPWNHVICGEVEPTGEQEKEADCPRVMLAEVVMEGSPTWSKTQ